MGGGAILPEWVGWVVVIGFGALLTLVTMVISWIDTKYFAAKSGVESVYTAGRDVKKGLTATVIVSQWTWAATLLQSSNVGWKFGVAGPFWYAAGATIQILLFAMLAVEVKRKAPNLHTMCEFMRVRHDPAARSESNKSNKFHHITFLFFGILTSCIVTAMLILGGAETVHLLTGMSLEAAAFLIPISVIAYTTVGGLKATFFASYLNTTVIFAVLWAFCLTVYSTSPEIGSAPAMFSLLQRAANLPANEKGEVLSDYPPDAEPHVIEGLEFLDGNADGSYLTMTSEGGAVFGIINIIGNFGTVFLDQSYWQSAIAARPKATVPGFMIAGFVWFAIPFTMATTLGLGPRALQVQISLEEANAGLVPAYAIEALMGGSGAFALLVMLFMAVTSTGSAELIAVSSILTYDVFLEYVPYGKRLFKELLENSRSTFEKTRKGDIYEGSDEQKRHDALGKKLLTITRTFTVSFGIFMGVLAIILLEIGLSLGFIFLAMGCLIGSGVIPVSLSFYWKGAKGFWCSFACWFGLAAGLIGWFSTAKIMYGEVNVDTVGNDYPFLIGNLCAIISGGSISIIGSLIFPDNFDWEVSRTAIKRTDESVLENLHAFERSPEFLAKEGKKARIAGWIASVMLVIIWPIPMYATNYVFSEQFFTFWVVLSIGWAFIGGVLITFLPIWEVFIATTRSKEVEMTRLGQSSLGRSSRNLFGTSIHDISLSDLGSAEAPGRRNKQSKLSIAYTVDVNENPKIDAIPEKSDSSDTASSSASEKKGSRGKSISLSGSA